eukprot:c44255_g1_i1 orf=381-617(+)
MMQGAILILKMAGSLVRTSSFNCPLQRAFADYSHFSYEALPILMDEKSLIHCTCACTHTDVCVHACVCAHTHVHNLII